MFKKAILTLFGLFTCSLFFIKNTQTSGPRKADILKQYNGNVVVIFTRSGCRPCSYLKPYANKAIQQCSDIVAFRNFHLNNSNKAWYKSEYGFSTFPTVMYFKNGVKVKQHGSGGAPSIVANVRAIYS